MTKLNSSFLDEDGSVLVNNTDGSLELEFCVWVMACRWQETQYSTVWDISMGRSFRGVVFSLHPYDFDLGWSWSNQEFHNEDGTLKDLYLEVYLHGWARLST